jgi:hypothetical protein
MPDSPVGSPVVLSGDGDPVTKTRCSEFKGEIAATFVGIATTIVVAIKAIITTLTSPEFGLRILFILSFIRSLHLIYHAVIEK